MTSTPPAGEHRIAHADEGAGVVVATHAGPTSPMAKPTRESIILLTGLGVDGDRHLGTTVQHGPAAAADPDRPNDRQVHLVPVEVLDGLRDRGYDIAPGGLGENLTTRGVDLLGLPRRTRLRIGPAVVELTGLRHPGPRDGGSRVDGAAERLDADGVPVGKVGVFAVVLAGGRVAPGDPVTVSRPEPPFERLGRI